MTTVDAPAPEYSKPRKKRAPRPRRPFTRKKATQPTPAEGAPQNAAQPVEATLVTPEEEAGLLDEAWSRRAKVQTLRLRGFTQQQIATAIGIDQSTVSRDLVWIRANREEIFGTTGKYDTNQELGEAIALFEDVERSALRDYARLPTSEVRDRLLCLRTATETRMKRLMTLQDAGYLERKIGTIGVHLRADVVRDAAIRDGLLLPTGSRVGGDDDPLEQWMRSEQ